MQTDFLNALKEVIPEHSSPNKCLAKLLDISETTASRKFTGKISLKFDHVERLLEVYPTLLNALIPTELKSNTLIGQYVSFSNEVDIMIYLHSVINTMEGAIENDLRLQYFARDLPLFLFLAHPVVFNYKVSMWCHNVSEEALQKEHPKLQALALKAYKLYLQLNTEEIWYSNLLNNQLFQLDYYTQCGKITTEQKQAVAKAYREVFENCHLWARTGKKDTGSYALHTTSYALLNNGGVFFYNDTPKLLTTSLSSIFYLSTSHKPTVESFMSEYEFHKGRATPIALTNETIRHQFFGQIQSSLNEITLGKI